MILKYDHHPYKEMHFRAPNRITWGGLAKWREHWLWSQKLQFEALSWKTGPLWQFFDAEERFKKDVVFLCSTLFRFSTCTHRGGGFWNLKKKYPSSRQEHCLDLNWQDNPWRHEQAMSSPSCSISERVWEVLRFSMSEKKREKRVTENRIACHTCVLFLCFSIVVVAT